MVNPQLSSECDDCKKQSTNLKEYKHYKFTRSGPKLKKVYALCNPCYVARVKRLKNGNDIR